MSRESVAKRASNGCGKTDVSLSSLKWLQAVLKSEAKVFCGRTLTTTVCSSYRTSTCILVSAVMSGSWDDDGMTSSSVGSALMIRIGRGLSRRTVRHGQITRVSVLTVVTTSLEAHPRPHPSRIPGFILIHLLVFRLSAIPGERRVVISWLFGVNPLVCGGGGRAGERTSWNVSRGSCRRGEGYRRSRPIPVGEIRGAYVQTKRSGTFASLIASHITFSTHPGMDFNAPEESVGLWHLPNIGQDLNRPLQPKVVGLDVNLLCLLVEPGSEEGHGRGHKVLYCEEPGISIGVTHPKRAASFYVPDRLLDGERHMPPRVLEERRKGFPLAIPWCLPLSI